MKSDANQVCGKTFCEGAETACPANFPELANNHSMNYLPTIWCRFHEINGSCCEVDIFLGSKSGEGAGCRL